MRFNFGLPPGQSPTDFWANIGGTPTFTRRVKMSAIPIDWVKKNKYSIITIMCKEIAQEIRIRHEDLYVEAHPRNIPNSASLNIRRVKTDESIDVCVMPSSGLDFSPHIVGQMAATNQFVAVARLTRKNKVSKKKCPEPLPFSLDNPTGTVALENWIEENIGNWFYPE
jgi:hypothetical protein